LVKEEGMLYSKFFAGRELKGVKFDKNGYSDTKVSPEKLKLLKTFGIEEKDPESEAPEKAIGIELSTDVGPVSVDKTKKPSKP
jgi:hypothetical protein